MKRQRLIYVGWVLSAFVFFAGALFQGKRYFAYSEKDFEANMELIKRTKELFYKELRWSWLSPDLKAIISDYKAAQLKDFDRLLLTTVVSRWRLQSVAFHSYENLVHDFSRGLWNDAFVRELTPFLNELDYTWIQSRQKAIASGEKIVPEMKASTEPGFNLRFPDKVTSSQIGSLLEVLITVGPGSTPADYVDVFWSTAQDPGPSNNRVSAATIEDTGQTTGGLPIYRVRLDMSQSPEWLLTSTEPVHVNFRGTPPVHWNPIAFTSTDSPFLPIPVAASKPLELSLD